MWWHTVTHGRGKWRGTWRMQWVASTLHTTSERGVSSITTADAHTSAASSLLNWRPTGRFKWTRPFRAKDEIWFLRVCHHISTDLYHNPSPPCSIALLRFCAVQITLCTQIKNDILWRLSLINPLSLKCTVHAIHVFVHTHNIFC